MPKQKQLPKPRTKFYVGEPVIVLPLAQYQRLANHLTDIALLDRLTQNQIAAVKVKHSALLKEVRSDLKAAKEYYKIVSTND